MKKSWILWFVIIGFVLIMVFWLVGINNKLVKMEENVSEKWAQVENVYQRRLDLIPNLVATVKGAADFEKSTLEGVINARAKATQVTVDPTKLTPDAIKNFQNAQDGLSTALGKLMVVVERYPEIKATANFQELQSQLEGTENRIAVERKNFNEAVKSYNTYLRKFPNNMMASMLGFEKKGYFEASEGAEKAPQVDFKF